MAIYNVDGDFATVYEDLGNPVLEGDTLICDKGAISGWDDRHVLLDDDVEPPGTLEEAKAIDKMPSLPKKSTNVEQLEQENEDLKQRTSLLEDALLAVLDLLP